MSLEIKRLHLAKLSPPGGGQGQWPVHGFVIATPGHTAGHQCVAVQTGDGSPDLLIGDAAYTPREYTGPLDQELLPGQAADRPSWEASIGKVRSMTPSRVHFCHHADVVHD